MVIDWERGEHNDFIAARISFLVDLFPNIQRPHMKVGACTIDVGGNCSPSCPVAKTYFKLIQFIPF